MNYGKRLVLGLCAVAVIAAGAIAQNYLPKSTRYRITVTVETPEGPKSGSSVIEVRKTKKFPLFSNYSGGTRISVMGEAVAVDLPGGQTLFALLKQDGTRSIGELIERTLNPDGRKAAPTRKVGDPPVPMNRWLVIDGEQLAEPGIPMLVRFRDINDPKTVELVDPDNSLKSFNSHYRLKSITIELSNDHLDSHIFNRLMWLHGLNGGYLHGGVTGRNAPLGLDGGDFGRGIFE